MNNERRAVRKKVLILASAILATSLLLPACSRNEAVVRVSCDDFYRENVVVREMVVPAGSSFKISLCGNPSSAWKWPEKAAISDDSLMAQTGHKSVMIPLGGAPGQEVWIFRAVEEGTGRVTIQSGYPSESNDSEIWRLELSVTID
ncbi:MAG: protease inhibitor I42 family protein [Dehalococcoidales bacterium]